MVNRNYARGRAKEYRIMKKLADAGYEIVIRSAGSHSPIDLIAIKRDGTIKFIQCKPKSFSKNKSKALSQEYEWLNNEFICSFEVKS